MSAINQTADFGFLEVALPVPQLSERSLHANSASRRMPEEFGEGLLRIINRLRAYQPEETQ